MMQAVILQVLANVVDVVATLFPFFVMLLIPIYMTNITYASKRTVSARDDAYGVEITLVTMN